MQHLRRWVGTVLRSFPGRQDGQVAITFGVCLVPLTFLVGAALDYSGAGDLKAKLQRATDAANLKLCQIPGTPTQAQLQQSAQTYMTTQMGGTNFTVENVVYTSSPRTIQLVTSSNFPTAIVRAFGDSLKTVKVGADAQCFGEPETFEIALVLDNTGSMSASSGGQSKMDALKIAATNFVNYVFSSSTLGPNTKVSLVPFAASVAVNPTTYRNASWIDQTGQASAHWSFVQGGATAATAAFNPIKVKNRLDLFDYIHSTVPSVSWAGCLESLPYPLNVQDGAPTPSNPNSYYVPIFAPDEFGSGGNIYDQSSNSYWANDWIDDGNSSSCIRNTNYMTGIGQACKYNPVKNYKLYSNVLTVGGPNAACTTRPLTRLTTSQSTLINEINAMQPLGTTDIHEGFMWGWRTLSPKSLFADGASYTKLYNNKILILMTDGMNTWFTSSDFQQMGINNANPALKSMYSAYGYIKNPDGSTSNNRLPSANANPVTGTQTRAAVDALTLEGCQSARTAGVTIYTIGFSVASEPIDQQGINMLKTCAGSPDRSFVANDSNGIVSVFQQIAASIGGQRFTH